MIIPTGNKLPANMNRDQVYALEAVFRDLAKGIDERGYKSIPAVDFSGTPDLNALGKVLRVTAGITLPANVFSQTGVEGHIFNVWNNSSSSLTITQGSGLTLRLGGTTTTGDRTLAAYGMMWVWYPTTSVCVVGGNVT